MKSFGASLLLLFFFAVVFQQVTVMGVYLLNQDFIAETFCINKNKPELQCKGKCHMNSIIADTTADDKEKAVNLEIQIQFPVFISETICFHSNLCLNQKVNLFKELNRKSSYLGQVFHPPPIV